MKCHDWLDDEWSGGFAFISIASDSEHPPRTGEGEVVRPTEADDLGLWEEDEIAAN